MATREGTSPPSFDDQNYENDVLEALAPFVKRAAGQDLSEEERSRLVSAARVEKEINSQHASSVRNEGLERRIKELEERLARLAAEARGREIPSPGRTEMYPALPYDQRMEGAQGPHVESGISPAEAAPSEGPPTQLLFPASPSLASSQTVGVTQGAPAAEPKTPAMPSAPSVAPSPTRRPQSGAELDPSVKQFIDKDLLVQERADLRRRWHEFYTTETRNGVRVLSGRIPQAEMQLRHQLLQAYRHNEALRSIFKLTKRKSINLREVAEIDPGVKAACQNYLREVHALNEVRKEIVGLAIVRRAIHDGLPDPHRFTSQEQQTWQRLKQEYEMFSSEIRTFDHELRSLTGELQTLRAERGQAQQVRDQLTQERDQLVQERSQAQQSGNQQEVQRLDGEIQKVEQAIQQKEQEIAQKEQEIQQKEQEVQQKETERSTKLGDPNQKREEIRAFIREVAIRQALSSADSLGAYAKVMTEAATTFLREGRLDTQVADVGLEYGMERYIRRLLAARAIGSVKEVRDAAVAAAQERAAAVDPQSAGKVRGFFRRLWAGMRGVTYPYQPGDLGASGAQPSPRVANLERRSKRAASGLRYGLAALVGAVRGGTLGVVSGAGAAAGVAVGATGSVVGLAGSFLGGYIGGEVGRKIGGLRTKYVAARGRDVLQRAAEAELQEAHDKGVFDPDQALWEESVNSAINTVAAKLAEAQSEGLGRTVGGVIGGAGAGWIGAGFARSLLDQPIHFSPPSDKELMAEPVAEPMPPQPVAEPKAEPMVQGEALPPEPPPAAQVE
ncbi:hypothetical protein D6792_01410, partial [Candidatus Parcubacteria bacterium]